MFCLSSCMLRYKIKLNAAFAIADGLNRECSKRVKKRRPRVIMNEFNLFLKAFMSSFVGSFPPEAEGGRGFTNYANVFIANIVDEIMAKPHPSPPLRVPPKL